MSLADIVRAGIATADKVTMSLQAKVQHSAYAGTTGFGDPNFDAPIERLALVDFRQEPKAGPGGTTIMSRVYVAFLRPIAARGGVADRKEPIDPRDVIILPDGSTGPIIAISGFVDAGTGKPYFAEVWLGAP